MKPICYLLILLLASCSTDKITQVSIKNENDYPIAITVKANNCSETYAGIQAHSEFKGDFNWTDIEKKDGEWIFLVQNTRSGGVDSFNHGYFVKGELYGYVELISQGSQLKVKVSE